MSNALPVTSSDPPSNKAIQNFNFSRDRLFFSFSRFFVFFAAIPQLTYE